MSTWRGWRPNWTPSESRSISSATTGAPCMSFVWRANGRTCCAHGAPTPPAPSHTTTSGTRRPMLGRRPAGGEVSRQSARDGCTRTSDVLRVAGDDPASRPRLRRGLRRGHGAVHPGAVPFGGPARAWLNGANSFPQRRFDPASLCSPRKTSTAAVKHDIAGSQRGPERNSLCSTDSAIGGWSKTRRWGQMPCVASGPRSKRPPGVRRDCRYAHATHADALLV